MKAHEITELYGRLDEIAKLDYEQRSQQDKAIASLRDHMGWPILRHTIEAMIAELLEPQDFDASTPGDVRLSVHEGKKYAIRSLRRVISMVESTNQALKLQRDDAQEVR